MLTAPDGSMESFKLDKTGEQMRVGQMPYLQEKVKEFTAKIKLARNTLPNDVWVTITLTIMKTLEHPMTALTITKQGWGEIMKPLLHCCLPVAGYLQNFPRAVTFGPSEQGGKGLMHPWYNQELTHLETLWEELASETHMGEFITTSMEALRLELGYPTSLMLVPFDRMAGCATDSWLTSLWQTCNKWNIDIKSIAPELKKARVYDQFVIQAFAQNKNITDKQLPILNECRCFHDIVTLADIVTACRNYLERDVLDGKGAHPLHSYKWPKKPPRLKAPYWKLWKTALLDTFKKKIQLQTS